MTAADWGIKTPAQGTPIVPFETPFQVMGDSIAAALDTLQGRAFLWIDKYSNLPASNPARQHATVYADPNSALNGDYIWVDGKWYFLPLATSGKAEVNSNSSSYQNITHGLGRTPSRVFCQPYGSRTARDISVRITNQTATDFQVAWYYDGAAYSSQSGTGQGIYWRAEA